MTEKKIRERFKRFPVRIRLVDWIVLSRERIPASPLIRELVSAYISRDPRLRDLKTYLEGSATNRETTAPNPGSAGDPVPGQVQVRDVPHLTGSSQDFQDQDFQDQDFQDPDPVQVRPRPDLEIALGHPQGERDYLPGDGKPRPITMSTVPLIDTL